MLAFLCTGFLTMGQLTAAFEDLNLSQDTFLNGSDLSGGFSSGNIFLPNSYNAEFESWTDWSISSMRDDTTAGYGNQYSAYAGSGADDSNTYAIASAFFPVKLKLLNNVADGITEGIHITNATYTALSMLNGDAFSKIFGGETGSDPDYLLLTIKGWFRGNLLVDSINFYLADYRFEDNSQDYIIKDWTFIDLSPLFAIDSMEFSLSSSDVGMFGMNTPAFFCIDNIEIQDAIIATSEVETEELKLYPNPAQDHIFVEGLETHSGTLSIYNMEGRMVANSKLAEGKINVDFLIPGLYTVRLKSKERIYLGRFLKEK